MKIEKVQLVIGGLLHDIGKVIYRNGDGRRHSQSGYDFLKEELGITEKNVLESVRYHHSKELRAASVSDDSYAYITYIADNIASAADRRENETEDIGFEISAPLEPVFNILNGNRKRMYYHAAMLENDYVINMPTEEKHVFDQYFYKKVRNNVYDNLKGITFDEEYVNSLLAILEANLTYVPSSTAKGELADISLFDHLKLTAALNSCIYDFLQERDEKDYKTLLFKNAKDFYDEKAFMLLSMDISGIQQFIYTIHSEGALKMLRARSFYLELMMEHIIDILLTKTEQSRANLLYAGGGHCYILLPNTKKINQAIKSYEKELNEWLLDTFDVDLYVAVGTAECSANSLKNIPQGSYSEIFRMISSTLSMKKSHRYTAEQIIRLNTVRQEDRTRECKVCKRIGKLNDNDECPMCQKLSGLSKNILYTDFFSVGTELDEKLNALPLPFGMYLYPETADSLRKRMEKDEGFIRAYSKNQFFTGKHIATKLWVGNYTTGETFKDFAIQSNGIKRIGVLRADVDNLGKTFISGFENSQNKDKYVTLSRTATLSRQLSLFFKYHINAILRNPVYTISGQKKDCRKAAIVYSGGDDLFIVGAWDDIVELAIDIQNKFCEYTEGTLTVSAGIGMYQPGFPIHVSAMEVAELEEDSKELPGKNAVTFLPDGQDHQVITEDLNINIGDGTYSWKEFTERVLGEKYAILSAFFENSEDKGKSFLYHLLDLIRGQNEKINLARYIYLLSRMEPREESTEEEKRRYQNFAKYMYEWIHSEKDCRELKTAINIYAYYVREGEEL